MSENPNNGEIIGKVAVAVGLLVFTDPVLKGLPILAGTVWVRTVDSAPWREWDCLTSRRDMAEVVSRCASFDFIHNEEDKSVEVSLALTATDLGRTKACVSYKTSSDRVGALHAATVKAVVEAAHALN